MSDRSDPQCLTRRATLIGGTAAGVCAATFAQAQSQPADLARAIRDITKGTTPTVGRVALQLPELAENGNSVSLLVTVDSPMTAEDHVRTIHILAEKNPMTVVARFHLTARAGRARVASNIRLASTQRVVAIAEMADGSFWQGEQSVIVTLAACIEGG